jgi:hypothetical protein
MLVCLWHVLCFIDGHDFLWSVQDFIYLCTLHFSDVPFVTCFLFIILPCSDTHLALRLSMFICTLFGSLHSTVTRYRGILLYLCVFCIPMQFVKLRGEIMLTATLVIISTFLSPNSCCHQH